MTTIEKIFDEFLEINYNNDFEVIDFYEKKSLILENINHFENEFYFRNYVQILGFYMMSLEKSGQYSKALTFADRTIIQINANIIKFNIDKRKFADFMNICVVKANIYNRQKRYSESIGVFEELVFLYPENENFKEMLEFEKSAKRKSINKYLFVLAIVFYISRYFFNGKSLFELQIYLVLLVLTFTTFSFALINEYVIDMVKKYRVTH